MRDTWIAGTQVVQFFNPTKIIFGVGSICQIVNELNRYGCKKPLLVSDHNIADLGLLNNLIELFNDASIQYAAFYDVLEEPYPEQVYECVKVYQNERCDGFLCVGGGSVMDTGKGAAILATNGGSVEDYAGIDKVKNPLPPLFCVPTTHGTGSEVAPAAVVKNKKKKFKFVIYSTYIYPKAAFLDPDFVYKLPQREAAADSFDALAHAIESVCASSSHPMSEASGLNAIEIIGKNIRRACTTREKQPALLMQIAASMALYAVGSTKAGLVHAASLALGGMMDVQHGIACGLFMPYVMEFNLISSPDKFRAIARALNVDSSELTDIQAGEKAIDEIKKIRDDLDLPKTLKDVGFKEEMLQTLIEGTMKSKILVENGHRVIGKDEVTFVLRKALG